MDPQEPRTMSELSEESFIQELGGKVNGQAEADHIINTHGTDQSYRDISPGNTFNASSQPMGDYSRVPRVSEDLNGAHTSFHPGVSLSCSVPPGAPPKSWKQRIGSSWQENKGIVFMGLSQFFGSAMAAIARLMETEFGDLPPMNPFQILFARQSVTVLFSLLYMWWAKVPDAPLGPRAVRPILFLRGFGGFFGVFGLYYSVIYLPLADGIVMTFLAPMLAAWISSLVMKTPFTSTQKIAGIVSIIGVVLITRPVSLFQSLTASAENTDQSSSNATFNELPGSLNSNLNGTDNSSQVDIHEPTPAQRAFAVLIGLIGVLGAACAYTTISWIGKRAHPLVSVNYFATWCTLISVIAMSFVPSVTFRLPATMREWLLLLALGLCGFSSQFLMTSGLAHKRSNRVLNVVYVQMIFALGFDKILWNETPGLLSILGSVLILGSVIWASVTKDGKKEDKKPGADQEQGTPLEEDAILIESEDVEYGEVEDLQDEPVESRGINHCLVEMRDIRR